MTLAELCLDCIVWHPQLRAALSAWAACAAVDRDDDDDDASPPVAAPLPPHLLAALLPRLRARGAAVSDAELVAISAHCENENENEGVVRTLDVSWCARLSAPALARAVAALPGLTEVWRRLHHPPSMHYSNAIETTVAFET